MQLSISRLLLVMKADSSGSSDGDDDDDAVTTCRGFITYTGEGKGLREREGGGGWQWPEARATRGQRVVRQVGFKPSNLPEIDSIIHHRGKPVEGLASPPVAASPRLPAAALLLR